MAFRISQNMRAKAWLGSVVESTTSMEYLGGRVKLLQIEVRTLELFDLKNGHSVSR
ncbi:hypothetical protein NNF59_001615 [Providencia stuartii]|uniref:hypothetical protein n=1 Tax=Providencia stuartii TaxID=588 RepID=UPI000AF493B9|nr:hypothetical protein [Providencia stuartii]EMF0916633.1 hypothetical protein [Providencia stuartii]MDT2015715.1 hypothetical protein [Providencia stuartii]MDT2081702.1 hypothetical protein [Providencia stuartii]HEM7146858.1 hypothetical protein [Providencia stuartii]